MSDVATTVDEVQAFFDESLPFFGEMNFRLDAIEPGVGQVRFVFDERWVRPGGFVNGGTLMLLADVAVYVAIFSRTGVVPMAVTNELKMNFLRPAVGGDVIATATLHKLGRRIAFGAVELYEPADRDRLVAYATASYALPD